MAATQKQAARRIAPVTTRGGDDLLNRLQALLYDYEALGELERARPHILWLMELARKDCAR
jgi:hypothetical protein